MVDGKPQVILSLNHRDPEVRYLAVMCLEYIGNAAAIPAFFDVPGGDDNDMRGAAARASASFGSLAADAVAALARADGKKVPWVRTAAACALKAVSNGE